MFLALNIAFARSAVRVEVGRTGAPPPPPSFGSGFSGGFGDYYRDTKTPNPPKTCALERFFKTDCAPLPPLHPLHCWWNFCVNGGDLELFHPPPSVWIIHDIFPDSECFCDHRVVGTYHVHRRKSIGFSCSSQTARCHMIGQNNWIPPIRQMLTDLGDLNVTPVCGGCLS